MLTGWSSFPVPPPQPQLFALQPTTSTCSPGALAATPAPPAPGSLALMPPSAALLQPQQLQPQPLLYSGLQPSMAATHGGAGLGLVTMPAPQSGAQPYYLASVGAGSPQQAGMSWTHCPCPCGGASPQPAQQAYVSAATPAYAQQLPPQQAAAAGWQQQGVPMYGGGGVGVAGGYGGVGPALTYGYGTAAAVVPGQGLAGQGTAPAVLQAGGYMTTAAGPPAMSWQAPPVVVGTAPF